MFTNNAISIIMKLTDLFENTAHENMHKFLTELKAIENRHINWFRSRAAQKEGELFDRLHHYYIIKSTTGQVSFKFIDNCDLPTEIQGQSMEAFYRNFTETN